MKLKDLLVRPSQIFLESAIGHSERGEEVLAVFGHLGLIQDDGVVEPALVAVLSNLGGRQCNIDRQV